MARAKPAAPRIAAAPRIQSGFHLLAKATAAVTRLIKTYFQSCAAARVKHDPAGEDEADGNRHECSLQANTRKGVWVENRCQARCTPKVSSTRRRAHRRRGDESNPANRATCQPTSVTNQDVRTGDGLGDGEEVNKLRVWSANDAGPRSRGGSRE